MVPFLSISAAAAPGDVSVVIAMTTVPSSGSRSCVMEYDAISMIRMRQYDKDEIRMIMMRLEG